MHWVCRAATPWGDAGSDTRYSPGQQQNKVNCHISGFKQFPKKSIDKNTNQHKSMESSVKRRHYIKRFICCYGSARVPGDSYILRIYIYILYTRVVSTIRIQRTHQAAKACCRHLKPSQGTRLFGLHNPGLEGINIDYIKYE